MRPTWRVRHIDPVLCPRFLVSSFGGDVDIDAKAIIVEGELVDDQGVLVQNVHLATNAVVRLDQVSNKLNLIGRGWPLVQQPAVWESPRGRNAKHQKKICRRKKNPTSTLFPACWGCGRASDRGRSKVTWAGFAFSSFKFGSKHIYYCGFTTVLKSILDLQRHCKAFHFHSQLSLDLPTSWSCFCPSCVASGLLLPSGEWSQSLPDADCCELGGPAIYPQLQQCHRPFHPTTSALWRSFEARLSYMTLSLSCRILSIKGLIRALLNALIMSW